MESEYSGERARSGVSGSGERIVDINKINSVCELTSSARLSRLQHSD